MYASILVQNTSLFPNLYPILTIKSTLSFYGVNIAHIVVKSIQFSYIKYLYFCRKYRNYEKY